MSTTPTRFVSVAEFRKRSSLSTSTVYLMMKRGDLDRPAKISPGRVGWPVEYVDQWLSSRGVQQEVIGALVEFVRKVDPSPPCTFTPFVKRVYELMAGPDAPGYDDLPEREQRPWRLLAHSMQRAA